MIISSRELQHNKNGENFTSGYRIVYFYGSDYSVGEYCKTIEGFMIGFAKCDPIIDENDIPEFISIDDLLNRYLIEIKEITGVALYNVNGNLIKKLDRNKIEYKHN